MGAHLIVGAGRFEREPGSTHLDMRPFDGIDIVHNMDVLPWPIPDNSFDRITAVHCVEHLKSLIDFMDEAHRILRVDGILWIETPNAGMNPDIEFCDPTHVRLYRPYTFHNYFTPYGIEKFGYTSKAWRIIEVKTVQLEVPDDVIIAKLSPIK